ncbi:outer membrane beta-barrel protein [Kaistella polysaccharea]|uniref:outer membrane beta-barrel protein n=1 Tax=Kaistella polysaccharea TaxID=2878534 RepID=UPI001CF11239|nr:outer membrane beta-barrel protein [Kaistella polysaccharea]
MKKINTLIALVLFITLSAQNSGAVRYGVTGNFHRGSIVNVHDVSTGSYGGTLGLLAEIPIMKSDVTGGEYLFLVPMVEYSMQGENAKADVARYGRQKFHHDYIGAQLYVKYFFHPGNNLSDYFIFAGPRIEFLVREDRQVSALYDADYFKYNHDDVLNNFGFGISVGAGARITDDLEAVLRFDRGFTKVYPNNTNGVTYNRQLSVGVNYYFRNNR